MTLALVAFADLNLVPDTISDVMNAYPIAIHPMTHGGSFFNKYQNPYESGVRMNLVGFHSVQPDLDSFTATLRKLTKTTRKDAYGVF